MTLQEVAFMANLIKRSYRRRMFWFSLHVLFFLISLSLTCFVIMSEKSGIIQIAGLLITAAIAAPIILRNADDISLPWVIKKRQADAIEQFKKTEFEELCCSVPLHEYFEI